MGKLNGELDGFHPIQEDSELEIFQRLFKEIIDCIELEIQEEIFLPHTSADVHEH